MRSRCNELTNRELETVFHDARWDIREPPDVDSVRLPTLLHLSHSRSMENLLQNVVCSDVLKLLIPVGEDARNSHLSIYYHIDVKGSTITIGDILERIYRFYNDVPVTHEDISHLSIVDPAKGNSILQVYHVNPRILQGMRLVDLMGARTKFAGLIHKADSFYAVNVTF
jgi:hypothetical protein